MTTDDLQSIIKSLKPKSVSIELKKGVNTLDIETYICLVSIVIRHNFNSTQL